MNSEKSTGLIAIPVYNEANNLQSVLDKLIAVFPRENLLFIDDGSSDTSRSILEQAAVPFVSHPVNLGYVDALRTAITAARQQSVDFVAFIDSDGQHRIEDLQRIIAEFQRTKADMILGSRYRNREHEKTTMRSAGTRVFSWLTSQLAGVEVSDVTCGLKLISSRFFSPTLNLLAEDMHAECIIGLSRAGARIVEIPITVEPRQTGTSMYHPIKAILYPTRTLLCVFINMLFKPQLDKPE